MISTAKPAYTIRCPATVNRPSNTADTVPVNHTGTTSQNPARRQIRAADHHGYVISAAPIPIAACRPHTTTGVPP